MAELLNRDSAEVLSEDDEVGRLANFQAALEAFLNGRKGAVDGVHADRCGQVDALVGATDIPGIVLPVGACPMLNNGLSCVCMS